MPVSRCPPSRIPSYSKLAEAPEGVPISALVFGGRRRELAPLVYQAKDWAHGVLVGASVASETTAAATGKVGVVRRDPMAMKPFCGYNYGDYWAHWLSLRASARRKLPKIFHVNWFRRDASGKFLWPGFGDNLRVLRWIIDRCEGRVAPSKHRSGSCRSLATSTCKGLDVSKATLEQLLAVDPEQWRKEMASIGEYFARVRRPPARRAQGRASEGRARARLRRRRSTLRRRSGRRAPSRAGPRGRAR